MKDTQKQPTMTVHYQRYGYVFEVLTDQSGLSKRMEVIATSRLEAFQAVITQLACEVLDRPDDINVMYPEVIRFVSVVEIKG